MNLKHTLWYEAPAAMWEEGLPCGNGRLGCVQLGGIRQERLQLNEDSLWSGGETHRINPDALPNLEKIRRFLREGRIQEAERLCLTALSGIPNSQRCYQTMGDLFLEFLDMPDNAEHYRRSLNIDTGIMGVEFLREDTAYTREVFSSYPDGVIAVRLTAKGQKKLHLRCHLERGLLYHTSGAEDNSTVWLQGGYQEDSSRFCSMLMLGETDGAPTTTGEFLEIQNAGNIVLYITGATEFREKEPAKRCREVLAQACKKGYEAIRADHIADFQPSMLAVDLVLGGEDLSRLPTDRRLARYALGEADPGLEALYFAFGRYLLLSSSRPGSLPANLQGVWNQEFFPPWGSKYTININTEMNYWHAETCALSQCHQPLFDLLDRMDANGHETAEKMYNCRGFVAHHNTSLHADTAPQDLWIPASYWPMGGAWLSTHLWRHYQYTLDKKFLEKHYHILADAVLFFADFLIKDEDGYYVVSPSVSPENTYRLENGETGSICAGCSMDGEILFDLFHCFLGAAGVLEKSDELTEKALEMLANLRPLAPASDGRLPEWSHEYEELEPGHRHISHLYGLYPGYQISVEDTPQLARAARKTLAYRLSHGGGHTGWSRAWIIGLWARLRDGRLAYENLRALLAKSTFPNLWDNHPLNDGYTFQIDGNFGATAAIAEMLVQSAPGRAILLPALPEGWPIGRVRGLRLIGNAGLDLSWEMGLLKEARLHADSDFECELIYGSIRRPISLKAGEEALLAF